MPGRARLQTGTRPADAPAGGAAPGELPNRSAVCHNRARTADWRTMAQHADEFRFDVDPRFRPLLWLWGVRKTARVEVGPLHGLVAHFGPVRVQTTLGNIAGAELTGPYRWWKAIGIRESWVDHGLTLGSTATGGVCIRFHAPVRALGRRARHRGLTVTVQDRELFRDVLNRLIDEVAP